MTDTRDWSLLNEKRSHISRPRYLITRRISSSSFFIRNNVETRTSLSLISLVRVENSKSFMLSLKTTVPRSLIFPWCQTYYRALPKLFRATNDPLIPHTYSKRKEKKRINARSHRFDAIVAEKRAAGPDLAYFWLYSLLALENAETGSPRATNAIVHRRRHRLSLSLLSLSFSLCFSLFFSPFLSHIHPILWQGEMLINRCSLIILWAQE